MASIRDRLKKGGAKGLPRSLDGLIDAIDEEIAAAGAAPKAYLSARMDDQNTDKTVGDHVEYDQVLKVDSSGDIALSTGGGDQTDGLITLAANKVYVITAGIRCDFTSTAGVIRVRLRDNTAAEEFGNQAEALALTGAGHAQALPITTGIIETSVETVVEVRITGVANFSSFRGGGAVGNSFLKIVEIG